MILKVLKKIISCFRNNDRYVVNKKNNRIGLNFSDERGVILKPRQIDGPKNIYIGKGSRVGIDAWIGAFESYGKQNFKPSIVIGDDVMIGNYSCITAIDNVTIEKGCLLSEYVYISDHGHGINPEFYESPSTQDLNSKGSVIIGENSFLGFRVCILPGVKLGKHCVVGANSVVTKSFPDYSMIGGIPARLLKKYNFNTKKWELQ